MDGMIMSAAPTTTTPTTTTTTIKDDDDDNPSPSPLPLPLREAVDPATSAEAPPPHEEYQYLDLVRKILEEGELRPDR